MLKVGQIRKSTNTSYLTDLSFTPTIVKNVGFEGSQDIFQDFAVQLNSGNFLPNNVYYVRVYIKRLPEETDPLKKIYNPDTVNFSVKLFQKDGGTTGEHRQEKIQTIENCIMAPFYDLRINEEWVQYTFVFTPNDEYKYLCFKINRIGYDYIYKDTDPRFPFIYNGVPVAGDNTMDFNEDGDFCVVNNILPNRKMIKIGIQSRPGSMFVVNREPIILGRSGVYEINNGTNITSVGVIAPNGSDTGNIQDFLLDYGYDNSSEED